MLSKRCASSLYLFLENCLILQCSLNYYLDDLGLLTLHDSTFVEHLTSHSI